MDKKYLKELLSFYEKEFKQTLEFWLSYGYDKVNGGFYTCLDEDGSVYDTDKAVWAQGRGMWVFARAYNMIEKDPRYLKCAMDAYDFVTKHCFDSDNRMFFTVTDDGQSIQKRRYWFYKIQFENV